MSHIIIDKAKADSIRGKHGKYSAIEPISLPYGNYIVPTACISDPDLVAVKASLEGMDNVVQEIVDLPEVGQPVEGGNIYRYSEGIEGGYSGLVIAVQSHTRMDYKPEETPALFTFHRTNSDDLEWIPNEKVDVGYKRMYGGKQYKVIQAHMTLTGWEPDKATTSWKVVSSGISDWVQPTGSQDAYPLGAKVTHNGSTWESTVDNNVWEPGVYGWVKI